MILLIGYIIGMIISVAIFMEFMDGEEFSFEVGFFSLFWPLFMIIVIPFLATLIVHLLAMPIRFLIQKLRH